MKPSATTKERGGANTIAAMLARGASFDEIDRERAKVEAADRESWRRKWQAAPQEKA